MSNLLGLSLDVGAIGWTLIDGDSMQVKAMGTHVFQVGSEHYGSGIREISKASLRTQNRIKRMRYSRKKMRKKFLIKVLIAHDLCPLNQGDCQKEFLKNIDRNQVFLDWIKLNPYHLRAKALKEKISKHEMGRILYHLSMRRGFPFGKRDSNSKENSLYTGIPQYNRRGIIELERKSEGRSIGEYFNSILPAENDSYKKTEIKIRNRFVSRDMYVSEAHAIWDKQSDYHADLTDSLRDTLIGSKDDKSLTKGAVFYQKPLRSQKHKVGKCAYDQSKSRCNVSNLIYQDLLAYKWINTIKKEGKRLSEEDVNKLYYFYMTHSKFTFSQVKELLQAETSNFNKKNSDIIYGSRLNYQLSNPDIFGVAWFDLPMETRHEIWHALYFFTNEEQLQAHATEKWGLSSEASIKFAKVSLDKRYGPISEKAAKNILFFLKRGVSYQLSVVLGGVKNSLKKVWHNIEENDIQFIINRVIKLYSENVSGGFISKLQEFLLDEMQLSDFQIKKLYGLQAQTLDFSILKKFPYGGNEDKEIGDFKNPLLRNTLFQSRKVINELIDKYGAIDELKAELNTNLKTNKFQRYIYRLDQRRVLKNRNRYISYIRSISENLTELNILKYELWEECKGICPYTGDDIPEDILFSDQIKVVHIHPWSKSLNDSTMNKTLCYGYFSSNIEHLSPHAYFIENTDAWESVVNRAKKIFSNTLDYPNNQKKYRRFVKKYYQRDYIKNQLEDPNFVSREVACFLTKVCFKVTVSADYTSDYLIRLLSLNKFIDSSKEKFKYIDLRNHALKSYVTAIRDMKYLNGLADLTKPSKNTNASPIPAPHPTFRDEVKYFINTILVSHRSYNRLFSTRTTVYKNGKTIISQKSFSPRGSLHRESVYGKRTPPNLETAYHIRKPLESIRTLGQVEKIVDINVKKVIYNILKKGNLSEDFSFVPSQVFFNTLPNGSKKTKVFLPNKNGDPVPIKKVRIRESLNSAVKLKDNIDQYVNLRNNHHVLVYKNEEDEFKEEVISFWEAIKRKKSDAAIYQAPNRKCKILTALHINDMFLMNLPEIHESFEDIPKELLVQNLYRVQKLSTYFYEFRQAHNNQLNTTKSPEYIRINNFGSRKTGWLTYNPVKVKISPTGEISLANENYSTKKRKVII